MRHAGLRMSLESQKFLMAELGGGVTTGRSDEFPYDLIEALITHITLSKDDGAILVFLPGWQEINQLQTKMKEEDQFRVGFGNSSRCKVLPLHSSVPTAGQQEVFDVPPRGVRKIILSTNIAETSVTVRILFKLSLFYKVILLL